MERMKLAEEYRGVRFRQIAPALRWPVGEGLGTQRLSKRPRDRRTLEFLDGEEGTIVEFEDEARIDVAQLLERGWIERIDQRTHAARMPLPEPTVVRPAGTPPPPPNETESAGG